MQVHLVPSVITNAKQRPRVRREATLRPTKSEPSQQAFLLHLVRVERAPSEQLALLVRVKRGSAVWLIVKTAAQLSELHAEVKARCASASVLKLPPFHKIAGDVVAINNGSSSREDAHEDDEVEGSDPVCGDPHLVLKVQTFLRRLVGGFPGPDIEAFLDPNSNVSRTLNPIEAWLFGPGVTRRPSKQGTLGKYRAKQWRERYFVLCGRLLFKYRSAKHYASQEGDPTGVYALRATTKASVYKIQNGGGDSDDNNNNKQRQAPESGDRFPFQLVVESGGKVRRLSCPTQKETTEWVDALNAQDAKKGTGRDHVVFGVNLRDVTYTKKDPWWRLSGPKPSQGPASVAFGAAQFVDELTGFLLATAKGKGDLFDRAPDPELVRQVTEGDGIDYTALQASPEKAAGLLLAFLHQLPVPLIPFQYHDSFVATFKIRDRRKRKKVVKLLTSLLPSLNLRVLRLIAGFLAHFLASLSLDEQRENVSAAFAMAIARSQSYYGDEASHSAAVTPQLLGLLMEYREKFWDYEEGFGEVACKPADATKSGDAGDDGEEEEEEEEEDVSRSDRSGTLDLFAHMAQGVASMRSEIQSTKSAAAKRRERRKKSFTYQKMAEGGLLPKAVMSSTLSPRVVPLVRRTGPESCERSSSDDSEGEQASPTSTDEARRKEPGVAAKRRDRRKRSKTRDLLEQLKSCPNATAAVATGLRHKAKADTETDNESSGGGEKRQRKVPPFSLTATAGSPVAAPTAGQEAGTLSQRMNARVAEIARRKEQRAIDLSSRSNQDPRPTTLRDASSAASSTNNQAYRNLGGGSIIQQRSRPLGEEGESKASSEPPPRSLSASSRELTRPTAEDDPYADEPTPGRQASTSLLLRELQSNKLAKQYRAQCVEIDTIGQERTLGFDPSQQAQRNQSFRTFDAGSKISQPDRS